MRAVTRAVTGLALLALLAGCARAPAPQAGYRAAGTPIYSNAVFLPDRLAGGWMQVADFAPAGAGACAARGLTVTPGGAGQLTVEADLCLGGETRRYAGPAAVSGPGRIRLTAADPADIGAEWWVLWVDADYRTLVVGTPSGSFGMILNRTSDLPPDRLAAAREVLAWNGYDLGRMRAVGTR
jgi:apolipoprotein D and lipocalin family protein